MNNPETKISEKDVIAAGLNTRWAVPTLALLALIVSSAPAQVTWSGSGTSTNWSDTANWVGSAVPTAADTVLFDFDSKTAASGVVDNIVDQNFTISALRYETVSTNGYHTTQIPTNISLNIQGSGGDAVNVGMGVLSSGTVNIYDRFVGPGVLSVTNTTGYIRVSQPGSDNDHYATLDLTGLTSFSASIQQLLVGATDIEDNRIMGRFYLADTNFIQTTANGSNAPGIIVGGQANNQTGKRGTQELQLGRYNVISSDAITVGGQKVAGSIRFRPGVAGGTAILRGSAGGTDPVKVLSAGDQRAGPQNYGNKGTSVSNSGTLDTTGNYLDALIMQLYVGRTTTNSSSTTTGVLTFDQGTITADDVFVGFHENGFISGQTANAVGTINVNGNAVLNVNHDLVLARKLGPSTPTATITVASNAVVNIKGNMVTAGGTTTLNTDGFVDLMPAGDSTKGYLSVSALSGSGTITNAAAVTNTSSVTIGGSLAAATLRIFGDYTLGTNATFNANLGSTTAVDSGVNDLLSVNGNLNLNSNLLSVIPLGSSLASGSYRLIDYTGLRNGYLSLTNPTRYNLALDYSVDKQVNLSVLGGAAASLKWNSATNSAWDLASTNFLNGSTPDRFFQADNVLVDGAGSATNLVLLSTTLYPGVVTVNSSTRDFAFGGSGKLTGGATIVKQGSSALIISNANDFLGSVVVSAGTLRLANSSALGSSAGGTSVANGATLDLMGFTDSDLTTISGAGINNTGAVINTAGRDDNGIRLLSLAGNASIGTYGLGRWDVRGAGGNGSFSGLLDLNNYTLTKLGATQFSAVDLIATNAGSIEVAEGYLSLTRSKVSGPGVIIAYSNTVHLENSSTGYVTKPMVFSGGTLRASGSDFELWSPVTNSSSLTIDNNVRLTLTNVLTGPGSLTKANSGNLVLQAINYTGPTIVSAGTLTVGTNTSLGGTPSIALGSGTNFATLDVSGPAAGLTLTTGHSLSGSGIVLGNVSAGPGASVTAGNSAGTLVLSNNLSLNGASSTFELNTNASFIGGFVNDLIAVNGTLNLSGLNAIKIAPLGTLDTGSPYTLFQFGTLVGDLSNLSVTSDSRYAFAPSINAATTPPSIQVTVTGTGTSADLVWKGGDPINPTLWDTRSTTNWLNGASLDKFYLGDNVQFDDSALRNNVSIPGDVRPGAMVVSNNLQNFSFTGAGALIAGTLEKTGSATLTLANSAANSVSSPVVLEAGALTLANSAANTFFGGAVVNGGTLNINNPANTFATPLLVNGGSVVFNQAADNIFSSVLADGGLASGSVVKAGANVLTLSANNTNFSGPIFVNSGTLRVGHSYALGSTNSGTVVASGATLDLNGISLNNPGDDITISGNGVGGQGAIVNSGANQNEGVRSVTLAGNATIGAFIGRFDIRGSGNDYSATAPLSGVLNLNGFTLAKVGPVQNSIVDCDVTSNGSIDIQGGMLSLTRCEVGNGFDFGVINLRTNVLFLENFGYGNVYKPLVSSGGTVRVAGNAFTLAAPITNLAGVTFDNSVTFTAAGTVTGPGALTKMGTGTAILTSYDNAWRGGTTIAAGTLQVGSGTSDGSIPDAPILNNGTLFFNTLIDTTVTNQISGTGVLSKRGETSTLTLTASNSFTGNVTTGTGANPQQSGGIIRIRNSYALGDGSVPKLVDIVRSELQLDGSLILPTNINLRTSTADLGFAGVGLVAVRNVSGSSMIQGPITLQGGGGSSVFQVDAGQLTLNGDIAPNTDSRTLILGGVAPGIVNGALTNAGSFVPSLEKRDAGTWTINASNTFSGSTTIKGGTLSLGPSASISASSGIDVQAGATFNVTALGGGFVLMTNQTLSGNGNIVGAVTARGTVAPGGTNVGSLAFSAALTFTPTSTNVMEIDKLNATNDLVTAASLAYGGNLTVTEISGTPPVLNDTFKLFNASSYAGGFSSLTLPALGSGLSWDTSRLAVDGTIKVVAGNFNPSNLTWSVSGTTIDISWPQDQTGWELQAQTNTISVGISPTWYTVPGSTTTNRIILNIDSTKGTVFYRLHTVKP